VACEVAVVAMVVPAGGCPVIESAIQSTRRGHRSLTYVGADARSTETPWWWVVGVNWNTLVSSHLAACKAVGGRLVCGERREGARRARDVAMGMAMTFVHRPC